jgi:hypothetical protein
MNLRVVMALNSISPIFLKDTPDKGSVGFDTSYMRSRFEYGYELGRRTGVAIIAAAAGVTWPVASIIAAAIAKLACLRIRVSLSVQRYQARCLTADDCELRTTPRFDNWSTCERIIRCQ